MTILITLWTLLTRKLTRRSCTIRGWWSWPSGTWSTAGKDGDRWQQIITHKMSTDWYLENRVLDSRKAKIISLSVWRTKIFYPSLANLCPLSRVSGLCSGSIINKRFVLSAAHCLTDKGKRKVGDLASFTRETCIISYIQSGWVQNLVVSDRALYLRPTFYKTSKYLTSGLIEEHITFEEGSRGRFIQVRYQGLMHAEERGKRGGGFSLVDSEEKEQYQASTVVPRRIQEAFLMPERLIQIYWTIYFENVFFV